MQFIQTTHIVGLYTCQSTKNCTRDIRNDQYPLLSNAFFCVNCGNIWARIHRSTQIRKFNWEVVYTQCIECSKKEGNKHRLNISGSIWNPFLDIRQLDYIPIEVLERELDILLDLEETKYE